MEGTLTALVIEPDENVRVQKIERAQAGKVFREILGGYLEFVPMVPGVMHGYVNEDGKALGLDLNPAATLLVSNIRKDPGVLYDAFRGPLIVLGDGKDGEEADCPHEANQALLDLYLEALESQEA